MISTEVEPGLIEYVSDHGDLFGHAERREDRKWYFIVHLSEMLPAEMNVDVWIAKGGAGFATAELVDSFALSFAVAAQFEVID